MRQNQKVSDQNDEEKFKIEDCQDIISDNEQKVSDQNEE